MDYNHKYKTNVYVDGFNLYYGCIKGSPYHWLDLKKLCSLLLTRNIISKIKYFTAKVSDRPDDPNKAWRQEVYLRALKTIPEIEIIYGQFKVRETKNPLVNKVCNDIENTKNHILVCRSEENDKIKQHLFYLNKNFTKLKQDNYFEPIPQDVVQSAYVIRTDEKGSDVNLATHLLYDGFKNEYEVAVVISDDSDLYESIRLVKTIGKKVGILNPQKRPPSRKLLSVADFVKQIREGVLKLSLFSNTLTDNQGTFHKPPEW